MRIPPPNGIIEVRKAISLGKLSSVIYCLSSGIDINEKDNDKKSLLHLAVSSQQLSIVEYLIKFGADVNSADIKLYRIYVIKPLFM